MALITKHHLDLRFTVTAEVHDHWVNFTVYDIEGGAEGATPGIYDVPLWHRKGAPTHPDTVDRLEDAEVYLHGRVKWDGCSDWHFDDQDRGMIHGCSREDVQRLGDVMARCWDDTATLCPRWCY